MKFKELQQLSNFFDNLDSISDDILSIIIKHSKIDINKQYKDGRTSLMKVIDNLNKENIEITEIIIKTLIEAGVDLNKKNNNGWTALMIAIRNSIPEKIIKLLIDARTNLNIQNNDGYTALMVAARYSKKKNIMKMLIDAGSDLNLQTNDGWTALMLASRYSNSDSCNENVKLLLDAKANINMIMNDGWTALMLAAHFSKTDSTEKTVKMLIDAGANLNLKNKSNYTALMYAAFNMGEYSTKETVKILINSDINIILKSDIDMKKKNIILKNIICYIPITEYNKFVDIFNYDISLLKPVKQMLLKYYRSQYFTEMNYWILNQSIVYDKLSVWIDIIHRYNYILEELFHNDPECVHYFSLLYMGLSY